jgi:hypothetical protein
MLRRFLAPPVGVGRHGTPALRAGAGPAAGYGAQRVTFRNIGLFRTGGWVTETLSRIAASRPSL